MGKFISNEIIKKVLLQLPVFGTSAAYIVCTGACYFRIHRTTCRAYSSQSVVHERTDCRIQLADEPSRVFCSVCAEPADLTDKEA